MEENQECETERKKRASEPGHTIKASHSGPSWSISHRSLTEFGGRGFAIEGLSLATTGLCLPQGSTPPKRDFSWLKFSLLQKCSWVKNKQTKARVSFWGAGVGHGYSSLINRSAFSPGKHWDKK